MSGPALQVVVVDVADLLEARIARRSSSVA